MSLTELNRRHRKRRRACDIWYPEKGQAVEPEESEEIEMVTVFKRDNTTVSMTRQAKPRDDLLGRDEQTQLRETIGAPVSTWSEAKAVMAEQDLRFVEKGDNRDRIGRERKEWIADGKPGDCPLPRAPLLGQMRAPNIRKLLKERGIG